MSNRTPYTPDLNLPNEVWLPVVTDRGIDFSELYLVSNMGRLRSLRYHNRNVDDLLTGALDKDGYVTNHLSVGSGPDYSQQHFKRHRLVMLTFVGPPPTPEHTVNHINEIKNKNELTNLGWMTPQEQNDHSQSIPVVQLDLNYNIVKIYKSSHEASRVTGFSQGAINDASKGNYNKKCEHRGTHKAYQHYWIQEDMFNKLSPDEITKIK